MDVWVIFLNFKTTKRKKKHFLQKHPYISQPMRMCQLSFQFISCLFFSFRGKDGLFVDNDDFCPHFEVPFPLINIPPFFFWFCLFNLSFLLSFHIHTRNGTSIYTYITLKNLFLCHPALSRHKISWKCISLSLFLSLYIYITYNLKY